jgi:signal transduction histidine kinase
MREARRYKTPAESPGGAGGVPELADGVAAERAGPMGRLRDTFSPGRVATAGTPALVQPIRREMLIANARLGLLTALFAVLWLAPSRPLYLPVPLVALMAGYAAWAALLAWLVSRMRRMAAATPRYLHAVDIAFLAPISLYSETWSDGPFLLGLVFALAAAMVRWRQPGVRLTALVLLALLAAEAAYLTIDPTAPIHMGTLGIRAVYLVVFTLLLSYFNTYEERLLARLAGLASRAASSPDVNARLTGLLGHVAALLDAPRVVLAWTDPAQKRGTIAEWTAEGFELRGASGEELRLLAPPEYSDVGFLAGATTRGEPGYRVVLVDASHVLTADPLPGWLRGGGPSPVALSVPLHGASVDGRLFVLDPREATTDELVLGDLLGREIATHIDQLALFDRHHTSGAAEERMRLARDLHDGVIQSLAAAGMRLEATRYVLAHDPATAEKAIDEVQQLLRNEQQELRDIIAALQPERAARAGAGVPLGQRLESLAAGMGRHWRLAVELGNSVPDNALTHTLARETAWIVREALVNAARHGRAKRVTVQLALADGALRITIADNGCGFRFKGRFDAARLRQSRLGPFNLTQRITTLGGQLLIESGDVGATLEITIPLPAPRAAE